ncbi:interleukin 12Ba precursor [Brachyhypopomus gauderio]|uniref:interleukin 12Ba precursor n=1 Tax=Brachyhypopomus gauderio TaxID=698409 RepID=UPI00404251C8
MIFLVFGVLFAVPYATMESIKVAESYWTLKANELVVDEDIAKYGSKFLVPLVCGEAFEGQDITWRREGGDELQQKGNRILVMVEERQGGNYSCYSREGSYLNHTLVLVRWPYRKIIKGTPEKGYIYCSAKSYSGSFQCSWTWDEKRAGKVVLIKVTRSNQEGIITCRMTSNGQGVTCQDQAYCPYAEEWDNINFTVYFQSNYVIETYHLQFQISDIVRPDMVHIKKNTTTLELQYPETWSTPFSYFPLTFQVKEIRCRKKNCDCSKHRPRKVHLTQGREWPLKEGVTVCVRAQDDLCNSSWSEWSRFRCMKNKKKNRRRGRQKEE